jgi:dihydrofolate synthase/folylpolyglutamate synthase
VSDLRRDVPQPGAADLSYAEAVRALESRGRYGIHLGLGRVRALLHAMGDPQLAVRGALVAGTNGKGSVIALAGAALRAAGYHVGETPKPHLVTYRERIVVDGRPIAAPTFARLVADTLPLVDRIARRLGPPTEFELLTAMMFRHFAESSLDLALVEVGLGGRLDATNAWDGGVAVVTNVDLDHMDRLGPTIPLIAREKATIIKRGDVAVTGAVNEALPVVRRRCARLGVPLTVVPPAPVAGWTRDGLRVELPRLGMTPIGLRGRHQAANAAVADALLDGLEAAGIATVPADARRRGYAGARWPGRLELLEVPGPDGGMREVLLDGAHNEAGAAALAQALDDLRPLLVGGSLDPRPPLTVVWASMADKDVEAVVAAMRRCGAMAGARVICTTVGVPRAMAADALAAVWRAGLPGVHATIVPDADVALDAALLPEPGAGPGAETGGAPGPVVVAGSLYLVGAARARFVDDPDLLDPVAT